jgi:UDP-N-acetylmuramoyl-tripeptide--D-alanyl-D-alanine ligase
MLYSINELNKGLKPINVFGNSNFSEMKVSSVVIDSRIAIADSVFFALKGANNDGHLFLDHAGNNGCRIFVIQEVNDKVKMAAKKYPDALFFVVENSFQALYNLATFRRSQLSGKVVAITGSLGKTTTKELVAKILETKHQVDYSDGNKNNHYGLPLSLANARKDSVITVLEMGMNHAGEIDKLSELAKPDIAVITIITPTHAGNFSDVSDIARAKAEIFNHMPHDGIAILNEENEYYEMLSGLAKEAGLKKILGIGKHNKSNFYITDHEIEFNRSSYKINWVEGGVKSSVDCSIPNMTYHNVFNSLFGFVIGRLFKVSVEDIIKCISKFSAIEGRGNMELINCMGKKLTVINDCYNASPESMKSALITMKVMKETSQKNSKVRTICVLGDMLELGEMSQEYHKNLLPVILESKIDMIHTVGKDMKFLHDIIPESIRGKHFNVVENAMRPIRDSLQDGDHILLKGSRSMHLEKIKSMLYAS